MPAVDNIGRADLVILYTQIGRGHPSYLDGIINRFEASDPGLRWYATDVFSLSHGTSLTAWRLVRRLYRFGGRGGVITALYGLLRRLLGSGEGNGMLSFFLGRDIKQALTGFRGPVLVAHPLLARIIRIDNLVIYQHGELAAPAEAIVPGCMAILVPRRETARIFLTSGIPDEIVHVTGQCVETELLPMVTHAFRARRERMAGKGPLTAALFSSGAYPRGHLHQLYLAAVSLYRAGHTVLLFLGQSEREAQRFVRRFSALELDVGRGPAGPHRLRVLCSSDRRQENRQVASLFGSLDLFLAPAHERTNWAVGLGLPQFILTPHIGTYAPLNAAIAHAQSVAREIAGNEEATGFAAIITQLRQDGRLAQMAENGFHPDQIDGFTQAARLAADLTGKI
jgi:hypothetical protein